MPQYTADFPAEAETEVAARIEEAADALYAQMQGSALEAALEAMQMVVTRFRRGDGSITTADAMRAAREIRALMHEKASLKRQCRAQVIEKLGLRPRPPVDRAKSQPAPSRTAPVAEPQSGEKIVKTPEPARGPLGDWLKVDVRQTEIPTDTTATRT
jgi:hypothetical protein